VQVLVSDAFYPAMVRENVSLVSSAVTGVTRDGVIDAQGNVHPLNIIVWATGERTHQSLVTAASRPAVV
jgi:NADH dehydrogenase FAD-containing subunit